jgi:hypothetical protein
MNVILLVIILFLLAILVQASKRAKQYKSILNRVAPTDPEYLLMITSKKVAK